MGNVWASIWIKNIQTRQLKKMCKSSKSCSPQSRFKSSVFGLFALTLSRQFGFKNVQKKFFWDPLNRSFYRDFKCFCDFYEIVTNEMLMFPLKLEMSHVRLLLDKTHCFGTRTHARTDAHDFLGTSTQKPLKGQLLLAPESVWNELRVRR